MNVKTFLNLLTFHVHFHVHIFLIISISSNRDIHRDSDQDIDRWETRRNHVDTGTVPVTVQMNVPIKTDVDKR